MTDEFKMPSRCHEEVDATFCVIADVPHCPQLLSWDCGLACSAMVVGFCLQQLQRSQKSPDALYELVYAAWEEHNLEERWTQELNEKTDPKEGSAPASAPVRGKASSSETQGGSVWSIDLLFVLDAALRSVLGELCTASNSFLVSKQLRAAPSGSDLTTAVASSSAANTAAPCIALHTTQAGPARPEYAEMSYYATSFEADAARISALFAIAASRRWCVREAHVRLGAILALLGTGKVVCICLVDVRRLRCPCVTAMAAAAAAKPSSSDEAAPAPAHYLGHYVVLCGYDRVRRLVLYRNPSRRDGALCAESLTNFDVARTAIGTDEDLIVVDLRCFATP